MLRSTLVFLMVLSLSCLTGCLFTHSKHTVIREDERLQAITFQSEQTRNAFEDHVQDCLNNDSNYSQSACAVPFIFGLQRSRKTSENGVRNDAIARFDINGDGYISDYEITLD